jgi:hypothetical protein
MSTLLPPQGSSMLGSGDSHAATNDERGLADATPPDLGALQTQSPKVSGASAMQTGTTSATLSANVSSVFEATLTATIAGQTVGSPVDVPAGSNTTFQIPITGLSPATTYTYTLTASNDEGTTSSSGKDTVSTPPDCSSPAPAILAGTAKSTTLPSGCTAPASGKLTLSVSTPPTHGTVTYDATSNMLTYTRAAGDTFLGADTFAYTLSFNGSASKSLTGTVNLIAGPSVTITSPASGATYTLGQSVNSAFTCADATGGPGISSCAGTNSNGQPIDTTTLGSKSYTVTATSQDGQTATTTVNYTVVLPSNQFTITKVKQKNGTITVTVSVPGAGVLTAGAATRKFTYANTVTQTASGPGTFTLTLPPTSKGRHAIAPPPANHKKHGKHQKKPKTITVTLSVTFTPTHGVANTVTQSVKV